MTNADLIHQLTELKEFAEAHHGDQPLHVIMHGLTVDVPERLRVIIESLDAKEPRKPIYEFSDCSDVLF